MVEKIGCEPLIRDRILQLADVVALVGTRVCINFVPPRKSAFPHIVIEYESEGPLELVGGENEGSIVASISVRHVAKTNEQARELEWLTRHGTLEVDDPSDGLVDWSGTINGRTAADVTFEQAIDQTDYPENGELAGVYEHIGRYLVRYNQPTRS